MFVIMFVIIFILGLIIWFILKPKTQNSTQEFNDKGYRLEEPSINKTGELDVPKDFVAIDIETATSSNSSICNIGLAIVENGEITNTYSFLIKPPKNEYHQSNIAIHGITPEMTTNALTFTRTWKELEPLINNKVLAAHYAHFDIPALIAAAKHSKKNLSILSILDSCIAARRAFPEIENHKLPTVCKHLDIPLHHHDAKSDAVACAQILLRIGKSPKINVEHIANKDEYNCYFFNRPAKPRKIWDKTWYEKYGEEYMDDDYDD